MSVRGILCGMAILTGLMSAPADCRAADESATAPPVAKTDTPPLRLEPGAVIEVQCETQAVLVATGAANATSGPIRLRLERTADPVQDGRWTPLGEAGAHAASLVTLQAKTCASGCPLMIGKEGDVQLWAPAPKSIDKLGADELLMLAVLKATTWQLKASTFRGQGIEALESGTCRTSGAEATPSAKPE